ncbi:MAG: nucleotide exchange factor GrpE [Bacteroidota bacterium]|nr:nucleotide exchange factor GrpE [Bacteroidota bacterium]
MTKGKNEKLKDKKEEKLKDSSEQQEIKKEKEEDSSEEKEITEDSDELEKEEEIEEEESEYDKLKREHDELHDKYLRQYSEFENFRRRTSKEKLQLIDHANERLLFDFISVIDDFERALQSIKENKSDDSKVIDDGLNLIFNKFKKLLKENDVTEIKCIGEAFDSEIHEALTKIPVTKKKLKGKIVDQVQKGYKHKDKVIRFSKVVVGE